MRCRAFDELEITEGGKVNGEVLVRRGSLVNNQDIC
jgi:hypothetical protein